MDLQPDFQRGEVWSDSKKQRLIDSIMREWHVPPVHVIELKESAKQEVLDGQQRLTAIRDFVAGKFPVDARIEPPDPMIQEVHGQYYSDLPPDWRRRFDQFTIRVFRITDYQPGEPSELFYRLNQPTNLTAAEQRNAFFGPARQQVKRLAGLFDELNIGKDFLGFSNSRMAYDDVVARLCTSLEAGTLSEKQTAGSLAARYRSTSPFDTTIEDRCADSIRLLASVRESLDVRIGLNKATLFSWLWFLGDVNASRLEEVDESDIATYFGFFESVRALVHLDPNQGETSSANSLAGGFIQRLLSLFNDRASARVADVSSVLIRDAVLWYVFATYLMASHPQAKLRGGKFQMLLEGKALAEVPEASPQRIVDSLITLPAWSKSL